MNQNKEKKSRIDPAIFDAVKTCIDRYYIGQGEEEYRFLLQTDDLCALTEAESKALKSEKRKTLQAPRSAVPLPKECAASDEILFDADAACPDFSADELSELVENAEMSFADTLLNLIDSKGLKDPVVYHRALIDRKTFHKIKSNITRPGKAVAISLGLALELDYDELQDFIGRADHQLSHAFKADIVVEYCVKHRIFDLNQVNEILYHFELPLLTKF